MNIDEKRLIEMHSTAVASIAIGKTVGVAPNALLYYIADSGMGNEKVNYVDDLKYIND